METELRKSFENLGMDSREPHPDQNPAVETQKEDVTGDKSIEEETQRSESQPSTEDNMDPITGQSPSGAHVQTEKEQESSRVNTQSYGHFASRHATARGIDGVVAVSVGAALMGLFNLIVKD